MPNENIVHSPVLGDIKTCRNGTISASRVHLGEKIEIAFISDSDDVFSELLPRAEEFWANREQHFKTFRETAFSELFDQSNACLDCGQPDPLQLTKAEFADMLRIPSGLTFMMTGFPNPVVSCVIGGNRDPRIEHEYIEVCIGMDGIAGDSEIKTLL